MLWLTALFLYFSTLKFLSSNCSAKLLNSSTNENDVIENIVSQHIASSLGKILSSKIHLAGLLKTKHGTAEPEAMYRKAQVSRSGLPDCREIQAATGQIINENIDEARVEIIHSLTITLGLYETACFHVEFDEKNGSLHRIGENPSLLYTIQYVRLFDEHPIRETYQFGIPQMKSDCKCDCPGGAAHCKDGDQYKNCSVSTGPVCYQLQHHNKAKKGCPNVAGQASLCCDVSITPYKNWRFWALRIGNPTTHAEFRYTVRQWHKDRWVTIAKNDNLKVTLMSGRDFQLGSDKLKLHVSGPAPHPLDTDTYFLKEGEQNLRQGVPVNRLHEWSLEKLGWFRVKDDVWSVRGGSAKLQSNHHVTVKNCKEQLYTEIFDAEYYVSSDNEGWRKTPIEQYLNNFVWSTEYWVLKNAVIMEKGQHRQVVITHRESPYLTLKIVMNSKPTIRFFQTASSLQDFIGKIQLDRHSNRFLNVTFINAHGSLNGIVYRNEEKTTPDHLLSQTLGSWTSPRNVTVLLSLPSSVNHSRWVCFYPNGFPHADVCHWLEFDSQPLRWFQVPKQWSEREGTCVGCNEFTVSNFWSYLNPRNWFNGVGSGVEALAMGFELFIYIVILVILFAIFRKCVYPLMKWAFCSKTKTRSKSEGAKTPTPV